MDQENIMNRIISQYIKKSATLWQLFIHFNYILNTHE